MTFDQIRIFARHQYAYGTTLTAALAAAREPGEAKQSKK